ncbi:uncharacterized protein LOC119864466 isoform X1 [Canis lupus familiaris]|uniref:uncharacterized protein LOC119864466 isoform X1 n=1 Tax=Canis lupus familiaris TaxID=9615 RepID=UPI0018F7D3E8|nr:uncharacterized protein LOC119864466 isoform X1 [Canis lupus familiaris]
MSPRSVRGWPAAGAPGLAAAPARCLRRRLLRLFRLLRLLRLLRRRRLLLVRAREAVLRGWRSRLLDSSRRGLGSAPGFQPCELKATKKCDPLPVHRVALGITAQADLKLDAQGIPLLGVKRTTRNCILITLTRNRGLEEESLPHMVTGGLYLNDTLKTKLLNENSFFP